MNVFKLHDMLFIVAIYASNEDDSSLSCMSYPPYTYENTYIYTTSYDSFVL